MPWHTWTLQTWLAVGAAVLAVAFTIFNVVLRFSDRRDYEALLARVKTLEQQVEQLRTRLMRWHHWYTRHTQSGCSLPDPPEQVDL